MRRGMCMGNYGGLVLLRRDRDAAEWQPLTKRIDSPAKPGYGGLSGVMVDPSHRPSLRRCQRSRHLPLDESGPIWQRLGVGFKGRTNGRAV